jgi:hypothetical protein
MSIMGPRTGGIKPRRVAHTLSFGTRALVAPTPRGESGGCLRRFAGSLDPVSAQEMIRAVDEECERVNVGEW